MKLVSVNIGLPRSLKWRGATFETGIFKQPVSGRIALRQTNLDGDRQADLSVHGGTNKAVYGYPTEHYEYWRNELPGVELEWGAFGENFTTSGLLETEVCVGDRYQIGSALIVVTTPRQPCFKLAAKFNRDDMIQRLLHSGRSGYYFSVAQAAERSPPGTSSDFSRGWIRPSRLLRWPISTHRLRRTLTCWKERYECSRCRRAGVHAFRRVWMSPAD